MSSEFNYLSALKSVENNNKVGTIESMLSGVASGLIGIPKGFFSLGASISNSCRKNYKIISKHRCARWCSF